LIDRDQIGSAGIAGDSMLDVLVVSDVALYRDGIVIALERDPRFRLVGTAGSRSGALAARLPRLRWSISAWPRRS
jgi:hypothetical protein